jgi:hypothetical protein
MSRTGINRRQFLTLPVVLALAPFATVSAGIHSRRGSYAAEVGLLYDTLTLRMAGTIDETVDRDAGRYDVRVGGEGAGVANRIESTGRRRDGVWAPLQTRSWFQVRGRESRSEILYDHDRRSIEYHFRGETFFLRRLRRVDDTVSVPDGARVDDVISALLNYAEDRWRPGPDGTYGTHVVRRRRRDEEGPDDVDPQGRAELVPLILRIAKEEASGKPIAVFDMTRFSSWARPGRPARLVFGTDRRPEVLTSSLMLGTSVTVRFRDSS